ncbi:MAG: hypothetical protein JKY88_16365 [Pseudomonadales bacterium]|nr:hypothetical protein [Pseudomonadales bacterium]
MEEIINALATGEITLITCVVWSCIAVVIGAIGGAIGGIIVGGKHIGYELAAMMGGFYGPIAVVPGVLLALIILFFI